MECGFNIVGFECCMVASADRSNRKRSAVLIILVLNVAWLHLLSDPIKTECSFNNIGFECSMAAGKSYY